MDDHVIEYLSGRIRASYRAITKNMRPNDEDDCVQDCLANYVEKGRGQTVDQSVIDFLRGTSGRKDSVNYETRMSLLNCKEMPESLSYEDSHHIPLDITLQLKGRLKIVVDMYSEGYSFKEIGQQLKITESRACQMFTSYTAKMQFIVGLPREVRSWAVNHVF